MKKVAIAIAAIALIASVGVAQPGEGRGRMNPEERQKVEQEAQVKRDAELREKLSLSEAVAHKVDSINHKYDKQQAELFKPENRGGERGAMRSQMENIQNARVAEVKGLLTPDQGKKYDEWLKERRQERQDRFRGEGRRGGGRPGGM